MRAVRIERNAIQGAIGEQSIRLRTPEGRAERIAELLALTAFYESRNDAESAQEYRMQAADLAV